MIEKVNGLHRNVVILLSILILAVTAILITVILSGGGSGKPSAESLEEFHEYFVKEYGVQPAISISTHGVSENQAETITKSLAKELKLNDPTYEEYEDSKWYTSKAEDGSISVSAFYE